MLLALSHGIWVDFRLTMGTMRSNYNSYLAEHLHKNITIIYDNPLIEVIVEVMVAYFEHRYRSSQRKIAYSLKGVGVAYTAYKFILVGNVFDRLWRWS